MSDPKRVEDVCPEFAKFLEAVANGNHPKVSAVSYKFSEIRIRLKTGQVLSKVYDRNSPCWCRSGLKFKKCHGR